MLVKKECSNGKRPSKAMGLLYLSSILILMLLMPSLAHAQLGPLACTGLSDGQLRRAGYEPVRAFPPEPSEIDDTKRVQRAIDAAITNRRMVYFHPGEYLVSDTLTVRQEPRNANGNTDLDRFGMTLLGSYCGDEKPTIRFRDMTCDEDDNGPLIDTPACHASETNLTRIARNPKPVILLMRDNEDIENLEPSRFGPGDDHHSGGDGDIADRSSSSRDWNQVVRNLHIVTGNNPGVVGIRHLGAEGSSAQDVSIDATGGFAGFYHINSSGGYTYNVEVTGGRHGLFVPFGRGGAMVVVGLTLRDQTHHPILINHYAPLTLVAADIKHDNGFEIIGGLTNRSTDPNSRLRGSQQSGGHLSLIDGQIEVTSNSPVFSNRPANDSIITGGRSVYMKNMYFKTSGNNRIVLDNGDANNESDLGNLLVESGGIWHHVTEYNVASDYVNERREPAGETKLIRGVITNATYYDDAECENHLCDRARDLVLDKENQVEVVPLGLREQHFYEVGLCNVEAKGMVFISPITTGVDNEQPLDDSIVNGMGAIPEDENENEDGDDSVAIQSAIDLAGSGSKRVFIPGGAAIPVTITRREDNRTFTEIGTNVERYHVRKTLILRDDVQLCGASRATSLISAGRQGDLRHDQSQENALDGDRWEPPNEPDSPRGLPIISTEDNANSKVVIADIGIHAPVPNQLPNTIPLEQSILEGTSFDGTPAGRALTTFAYDPYVFHLDWRAGRNSVVKDVWWKYDFGDSGERVSVQINNNGGGRWYGITQQNGYRPHFRNGDGVPRARDIPSELPTLIAGNPSQDVDPQENESFFYTGNLSRLNLSPKSKHMVIDGTNEPLSFYPFHCQHITLPFGSQCDIQNAKNVSLYGIKQEAASTPEIIAAVIYYNEALSTDETFSSDIVPIWMRIKDSHNINLFGYESHSEYASGRGAIEISGDNSNITITNMATRDFNSRLVNPDDWYFVKENVNGIEQGISSASGIMPLFKSSDIAPLIEEDTPILNTAGVTPSYIFNSTHRGRVVFGGSCQSLEEIEVVTGTNTIELNALNALEPGTYDDCTIQVVNNKGQASNVLNVNTFTIGQFSSPTLIASWPFNDGSGTQATDAIGGNDGQLLGSSLPIWNSSSPILGSHALDFSANSGDNPIVEVDHSNEFLADQFSLSVWFKLTSELPGTKGVNEVVVRKRAGSGNFRAWDLIALHANNKLRFRVTTIGANDEEFEAFAESNQELKLDVWYHAVGRLGQDGDVTLHLAESGFNDNQSLQDRTGRAETSNVFDIDPRSLVIGAGSRNNTGLQGSVDDVCYFSGAISTDQIENLYNGGTGRECQSLNNSDEGLCFPIKNQNDEMLLMCF